MDYLAATYDYVSVSSIGESYEGRDMRVSERQLNHAVFSIELSGVDERGKAHHTIFSSGPQMTSQFISISSNHTFFRPGIVFMFSDVYCYVI